jgi:hypothetical protein
LVSVKTAGAYETETSAPWPFSACEHHDGGGAIAIDLQLACFGSTSASHAFYKKMFDLYNAAPAISSAIAGSVAPGDPGCGDFEGLGPEVPCILHFNTTRSRPSQDALNSGRVDWNIGASDRAFLKLQNDTGYSAVYTDPITPVFDNDLHPRWWQSQFNETHGFGPSAALQTLVTGSYVDDILGPKDAGKTLETFPTYLFFNTVEQIYPLGDPFRFRGYFTQYQISEDLVKAWGSEVRIWRKLRTQLLDGRGTYR